MKKVELFPTPFWKVEFPQVDNSVLLQNIYQEYERSGRIMRTTHSDTKEKKHTNWSSEDINPSSYPELHKLCSLVMGAAEEAIKEFSPKEGYRLILCNLWYNINKTGQSVAPHQHPGTVLAGVYYVNVNDNSACLSFMNPDKVVSWVYNPRLFPNRTKYTEPFHKNVPKNGTFVLFPGNLQHYVDSHEDPEDRVSIAFNININ